MGLDPSSEGTSFGVRWGLIQVRKRRCHLKRRRGLLVLVVWKELGSDPSRKKVRDCRISGLGWNISGSSRCSRFLSRDWAVEESEVCKADLSTTELSYSTHTVKP
jgi:hypothetical protein